MTGFWRLYNLTGIATLLCQLLTVGLLITTITLASWQVGTDGEHSVVRLR
jgi:hypothetical protein